MGDQPPSRWAGARAHTAAVMAALTAGDIEGPAGYRAQITALGRSPGGRDLRAALHAWAVLLASTGWTGEELFTDRSAVDADTVRLAGRLVEAAASVRDGWAEDAELETAIDALSVPSLDEQVRQLTWLMARRTHDLLTVVGGMDHLDELTAAVETFAVRGSGQEFLTGSMAVILGAATTGRLDLGSAVSGRLDQTPLTGPGAHADSAPPAHRQRRVG
jgi:hypothetical protein